MTDFCKPSSLDFSGKVVLFNVWDSQCVGTADSNELLYKNIASSNALGFAWIQAPGTYQPSGAGYYAWSLQWETGANGMSESTVYFGMYDATADGFTVDLTHNTHSEWLDAYDGWVFITGGRVLPVIFAGFLFRLAFSFYKELGGDVDKGKKIVVIVECVGWLILAVMAILHGWVPGSDWVSREFSVINGSELSGTGFFTTTIMALQLYEARQSAKQMRKVRPVTEAYKKTLCATCFFCLFLLDFCFVIVLTALGAMPVVLLIFFNAMILIVGQIAVATFFIVQGYKMHKMIKAATTGGSGANKAQMSRALARMTKMLAISALFMLISVVGIALIGGAETTPSMWVLAFFLVCWGRAGGSYTKLLASEPPKKRFDADGKSVASSTSTETDSSENDCKSPPPQQVRKLSSAADSAKVGVAD